MSSSTSHAYEWLKQLPSSLLHFEETPVIGLSPPFPWKNLSESLANLFERPIEIRPNEVQYRASEELLLDKNKNLFTKFVAIDPLEGYACFILPKRAIGQLISHLVKQEESPLDQFDPDFQDSFADFLAIEALYSISHLDFDPGLSFRLLEERELPKNHALCLDIDFVLPKQTLKGRLILSPELSNAWKERCSTQQFDLLLHSSIAKNVPITVHLEGGRVNLTQGELKRLKPGDFVILDSCTLQPDLKGRVMLTVNDRPFMRGKLKEDSLKLLEFPVLEPGASMEREEEEVYSEEPGEGEEENLDFGEEEIDFGEGSELEELEEAPKEKPAPVKAEAIAKLSPETLPMTLVIEAGRLQLTLQKLLELQPGSMLELDLTPQSGVDLVVNGKKIGKGELIAIGDVLGVRILEI